MNIESVAFEWSYGDIVEPLSVHIVETGETTVLVGGGDEPIAEDLCALARQHDVDIVVAEHGHIDHYGAIPALVDDRDMEVAAPAEDAHVLREAGITVDHELVGGETYWGIEAIATPGHTPGNMAFLVGETLLAGDTAVGSDSQFAAERAWSGPLALLDPQYTVDQDQAARSVATLRESDIESLRVSHGSHVHSGAADAIEALCSDLSV